MTVEGDGFRLKADDAEAKPLHAVELSFNPAETTARGDLRRVFEVTTDLAGEGPVELTATARVEP